MEEASPLGGSFLDVDPAQGKKPSTRKKNIPIILLINIIFNYFTKKTLYYYILEF